MTAPWSRPPDMGPKEGFRVQTFEWRHGQRAVFVSVAEDEVAVTRIVKEESAWEQKHGTVASVVNERRVTTTIIYDRSPRPDDFVSDWQWLEEGAT